MRVQVLQNTRGVLKDKYDQIPQLSVGAQYDLDQVVSVSSFIALVVSYIICIKFVVLTSKKL